MPKPIISYADFAKLDIRIGTITAMEPVEKSEKLLKLLIDLGDLGKKTILSGIKKYFDPTILIGTQVVVLANLEPKRMMGIESQGMILMAVSVPSDDGTSPSQGELITLLIPQNKVLEGTGVE